MNGYYGFYWIADTPGWFCSHVIHNSLGLTGQTIRNKTITPEKWISSTLSFNLKKSKNLSLNNLVVITELDLFSSKKIVLIYFPK